MPIVTRKMNCEMIAGGRRRKAGLSHSPQASQFKSARSTVCTLPHNITQLKGGKAGPRSAGPVFRVMACPEGPGCLGAVRAAAAAAVLQQPGVTEQRRACRTRWRPAAAGTVTVTGTVTTADRIPGRRSRHDAAAGGGCCRRRTRTVPVTVPR